MAHLSNNQTVVIKGSNTFNAVIQTGDSIDEGLKILCKHTAPGALHNSGERFDPPNCHPGTRTAVREKIMSWIDDPSSECPVMWMNGAMGGGKSSIAQSLAELYHQKQQLSGSFFFARASPSRNNEKSLVATLAYQMWIEMPHTQPYISASIRRNPLIFNTSLKQQFETLIITPHLHSGNSNGSASSKPRLIILDGLDECINKDTQALIVKTLVSSIAAHRNELPISLKILIVSRPEIDIDTAFRDPKLSRSVELLLLNERWLPSDDIRRFLVNSFEDIRRESRDSLQRMTLTEDWPANPDIDKLVEKSSGQFIYASVAIRFLRSPQTHPIQSLKVILGLAGDDQNLYAELDALYEHIFSQVKDLELVLRILSLRLIPLYGSVINSMTRSLIENILNLPKGMLIVALVNLVSVLVLDPENEHIHFSHASLSEFLLDKYRSGRFFVNGEEIRVDLAGRCVPFAKNPELPKNSILRLYIFKHMYKDLGAEARSLLCDRLSDMDIMSALEAMSSDVGVYKDAVSMYEAIKYMSWFFAEHEKNSTTNLPNSLGNAVELCSLYIMRQFKAFPFSGFDRADGVDVWIFAMSGGQRGYRPIPAEVLSILTESDCSEFENLQKSRSAKFCWDILYSIPHNILSNVELFGKYAMTGDRYIYAALCLFEAIPKTKSSPGEDNGRHLVYLEYNGWERITTVLCQTPASKDLYKCFKKKMVPHTSQTFSEEDSLQELVSEYVWSTFGHGYYSTEVVSIFCNYMEKRFQILTLSLKTSGRQNII